jgi:hypothetical protein
MADGADGVMLALPAAALGGCEAAVAEGEVCDADGFPGCGVRFAFGLFCSGFGDPALAEARGNPWSRSVLSAATAGGFSGVSLLRGFTCMEPF